MKRPIDFFDWGTIGLIVLFLIGVYGFLLFWWYWNRKGKATEAYAYVMAIYGTGSLIMGFGVYARWLRVYDVGEFSLFLSSDIWGLRLLPLIVVMGGITVRLTMKAFRAIKYEKEKYDRRENGSRTESKSKRD